MFSYSTGYYVSPPNDQYLKFKNRCCLVHSMLNPMFWCCIGLLKLLLLQRLTCGYTEHTFDNCLTLDAVTTSAGGCDCADGTPCFDVVSDCWSCCYCSDWLVDMQNIRLITVLFLMLPLYFSFWLCVWWTLCLMLYRMLMLLLLHTADLWMRKNIRFDVSRVSGSWCRCYFSSWQRMCRSPVFSYAISGCWCCLLLQRLAVGVLNPMYWCCIGLLMLFAVAAVGCACAEPHVLMLYRSVDAVCCCSGWLCVCWTPCIVVVSDWWCCLLLQRLAVAVRNPMYWCCIGLLMLFAVAAVGCSCAEPHVLMLYRTVDAVCCCSGWLWACWTPCIDVVSVCWCHLLLQRLAVGVRNPWDYKTWDDHGTHHDKWSQYPDHHRSSGPVCGLDPA